jgi:glycosyltransferase involved in cell wall biosynthesis
MLISHVIVSFVIPAYNEEQYIQDTLDNLHTVAQDINKLCEIIVVNDGSRDKTLAKVVEYAQKNQKVKVVSYPLNMGKGYALKKGFMETNGDIVVFADSDMEINLDVVSSYVQALEDGDIVIASKWHKDSKVDVSTTRKLLSRGFNILVQLLLGMRVTDTQAGLKAIRKSAFLKIFPKLAVKKYAFDVELLAVANHYHLRIIEQRVDLKLTASFKPKQIWLMFADLLGIAYRLRIRRCY